METLTQAQTAALATRTVIAREKWVQTQEQKGQVRRSRLKECYRKRRWLRIVKG